MKWNPQTLQFLSQTFLDTLSPHPEVRRRAEKNLSDAADNYGLAVLRLVAEPSFDEQISLPDSEKEQIKSLIVPLMLSATPKIQAQFIEALASIGNQDFPNLWPALLPDLNSRLETGITASDFASVNCILAAVNSLFNKFRSQFNKSNPILLLDLKYCVDNFGATLLITAESILRKINASVGAGSYSVATLGQLLEAQRLCCKIFYSLNFLDVPEKFEDIYNAADDDQWMNEFKNYQTIEDSFVCDHISHYMEKKEELLQKHLNDFLKVVRSLLVAASVSPSRERLTVAAIKFLTIVSTSVHHELFAGDDDKLEQITQNIVIPYVMLRNEDEELIKKNCIEFIKKDMDGNDRRRNAFELLKGIAGNYKEKISTQIHHCLALFAENPTANWKYKEFAIYLVVSTLATGGGTDLVDVKGFFRSVIVPELQGKDVNAFPMLKAAALKFFTVFSVFIPKHVAKPLLCDVVRYICSDVNVVRSYAAICIEKLLLVKVNNKNGVVQVRYTSKDIGPLHKDLFFNLFGALEILEKNHYIMRCIMRVVQIADISEMYSGYMFGLSRALDLVGIGKPKNLALYNHFLFEAIACFVRRACEMEHDKDPCFVTGFQTCILRIFIDPIWRGDATELFPYAFQLLAQLVDFNTPLKFMDKFDEIFLRDPDFELWENSANVFSLVRLLQSYLQQAPREVNRKGTGRLRHVVLGIINKLISSPTTEEQGFHLLNTVIQSYGYDVVAEYMNHIWASVFIRLQSSTTPRLVRRVIIFMSLFLVKHGVQTLVDLINSVQVDSFHVIMHEFWIPYLKTISTGYNYAEVKLSSIASTKLLFESASLLNPAVEELWGKLLDAIVTLLSQPLPLPDQEERFEYDDPDFHSGFVPLQNIGGRKKKDPLNEITDTKHCLVAFPAHLSSQFHGKFPLVLMRHLSPPNQAALVNTCNSYNIAIV